MDKNIAVQDIFYNPEFEGDSKFQSISNFKDMTETIFQEEDGTQECMIFQYHDIVFDIDEIQKVVWSPSIEHYTAYLGLVSFEENWPSAHGFVGSDSTGNQFTAFFDTDTLRPFMVKYQK